MSLELFNGVPARAIEVLVDAENQPWFKRAHVEKYLGLSGIHMSLKTVDKREMPARSMFDPTCSKTSGWSGPKDQQNSTDIFLSVYAVMHLIVRGKNTKGKELKEWIMRDIIPRGLNQVIAEKQGIIEEKDTQLALLNDDLTESEKQIVNRIQRNQSISMLTSA